MILFFFQLLNVKMPTIVGILTVMSRKNFILSLVEQGKSCTTSGHGNLKLARTQAADFQVQMRLSS